MKRIKVNLKKMHNYNSYLILSLFAFLFSCLLLQATLTTGSLTTLPGKETGIGVILDQTSRPGKETKVAIELAVEDLKIKTNQHSVLYLQNTRNKPVYTAIAAKQLIDEKNVKAIIGGHTWEEASAIAEVISEANHDIPVFLSLAGTTPLQATDQWPFFVQGVPTQSTQMNAIAAILQSLGISQATLIYDTSSSPSIISHLSQAVRKTGPELTHILPLSSSSISIEEELDVLKRQQRKVFVLHTSLELAIRLFQTAKKMEMTGEGYLWIATNAITDLLHSINSNMISSLKGMVGVKSYFQETTPDFTNFKRRFRQKFHADYPEEEHEEPGIFAVQGYNAMKMLEKKSPENFRNWKPVEANIVEIVYVIGKRYQSVYWTEGSGFSETVEDDIKGATNYTHYMDNVGQLLWPVQPWYANRRGRNLAETSQNRMRVGVPAESLFEQFVRVDRDTNTTDGFVIEVFDEMMKKMNQLYDLYPFNDSYDKLVKAVGSEFDAVAGDVTITEERHKYAHFTQPFTESGLEMIVPVRSRLSNQAWLFMKPFTKAMWWLIVFVTIYNGFIVWLIERSHNEDLRGSVITQTGIVIWLGFTTLFTLRGDKLHSNLSRMAVVMWLFVALIITQSYTASLASMLTAQRLEPSIASVEMLRNMNAPVGYCNGSFVNNYLTNVLRFENVKVKNYSSTDRYAEALNSGEIAAIFLEVPAAKVFLAQYCKSFIRTGETFKVGGFGFAFPKDSPRLSEANKALMNVTESRKLKELEDEYINSQKCVDDESSPDKDERLSAHSFWVLFMLTGGTSTIALIIYIIISIRENKESDQEHGNIIKLVSAFIKDWQRKIKRSSSLVVNVESARHTRNMDQVTQDDMDDSQEVHGSIHDHRFIVDY